MHRKKMRILLVAMICVLSAGGAFTAFAQDENERRVYNRSYSAGVPVFNSYSGQSTLGRPLSLQQILENRENAATGDYTYYGGTNYRPYGIDNNSFSLGLDEADFRRARANRDRLAQQRERENLVSLQNQANYNQYPQSYSPAGYTGSSGYTQGSPVRLAPFNLKRKQREKKDGFEMPRRIFNSVE
ncbi:MAG: hypothetical protein MRY79_07080 [Alphaproteobacteria bacterium]|nr:hypothetical protein [Alphaproteobacteria bacterium]